MLNVDLMIVLQFLELTIDVLILIVLSDIIRKTPRT